MSRLTKAQRKCLTALSTGLIIRVRLGWFTAYYTDGEDKRRMHRVSDLTVRSLHKRGYLDRYSADGVEEFSLKA